MFRLRWIRRPAAGFGRAVHMRFPSARRSSRCCGKSRPDIGRRAFGSARRNRTSRRSANGIWESCSHPNWALIDGDDTRRSMAKQATALQGAFGVRKLACALFCGSLLPQARNDQIPQRNSFPFPKIDYFHQRNPWHTRSLRAYRLPQRSVDIPREVGPHLAASFGNVFLCDLDAEIGTESFQAAQRPLCASIRFHGLHECQDFFLLLGRQSSKLLQHHFFDRHRGSRSVSHYKPRKATIETEGVAWLLASQLSFNVQSLPSACLTTASSFC